MLFQVYFLALLLEERGAGDLAAVAEHVPPEADPAPPARLRRRRGRARRRRRCATGTRSSDRARERAARSSARSPRTCRRCCTRGRCSAAPRRPGSTSTSPYEASTAARGARRPMATRRHAVGDLLFAAVNVARKLKVDPELACAPRRGSGPASRQPRAGRPRRAWNDLRRPSGLLREARLRGGRHERDREGPRPADPRLAAATPPSRSRSCSLRATGRAAVPSGASTGEFEAVELRDGGERYGGKGVTEAVGQRQRRDRRGASTGLDAADQRGIDRALIDLDGTTTRPASAPTPSSASRWPSPRRPRPRSGLPLCRYLGGDARPRAARCR